MLTGGQASDNNDKCLAARWPLSPSRSGKLVEFAEVQEVRTGLVSRRASFAPLACRCRCCFKSDQIGPSNPIRFESSRAREQTSGIAQRNECLLLSLCRRRLGRKPLVTYGRPASMRLITIYSFSLLFDCFFTFGQFGNLINRLAWMFLKFSREPRNLFSCCRRRCSF